jgi:predicted kinase
MTFSKIEAKETRELTRTLEKKLENKLAYSDIAVIDSYRAKGERHTD